MRIQVILKVPDELLNSQAVVNAIIQKQQTNTAPDVEHLFRQTVVGWNNAPTFGHAQHIQTDSIGMEIHSSGPNSSQYALVNAGSPPHPIPLPGTFARGGFLRFQTGYTPSTRPRVLASRAFVRSGPFVARVRVNHPGFVAREFDQEIADEYRDTFRRDMQDALGSAIP